MTTPQGRPWAEPARLVPGRPGPRVACVLLISTVTLACGMRPFHRSAPAETERTTAAEHFEEALSAHSRGDYEEASSRLRIVRERCTGTRLGDRAFLLVVATRLDPRFRNRRPDSMAVGTVRYLSRDSISRWGRAMAESLHLVARDLGRGGGAEPPSTPPDRRTGGGECELPASADVPSEGDRAVPTLSRPSLHARLGSLRARLDSLEEADRERLGSLRTQVDSLQAEITRLRQLLKSPRR